MEYALDGGMRYSVSMKVAYELDGDGVFEESLSVVASFADVVGKIPNGPDGKRWEVCVVVA